MNYRLKSKPKHIHRGKIISLVALFILLSLSGFFLPNFTKNVAYTISRPLWFVNSTISNSFMAVKDFFAFKNNLINQNLALTDEVTRLQLKEIDYDNVIKENENLKNQLGLKGSKDRTLSRVLSKPPQSPYDTLVIDGGSAAGIGLGNKVYLSDTIIIGTIVNVTPNTSLVELFSNSNHKQQVVSDRTGASFEALGRGGANLSIEVPKDTDILWGDSFSYLGLSASTIATVYYIDTNSQSSFKTVYLRMSGSVLSSRWVFVEKNQ